jgi:uncharacterized protein (DUF927 family)
VRQAIEQVRAFIESHGQSRFEDVDADELARTVHNRAGWRRKSGSAAEWLCLPEVWKREICQGIDPKLAARVLAEAGMLQRSTDGFQVVVKINGVPRRVYQLNAKIMAGVDHDA